MASLRALCQELIIFNRISRRPSSYLLRPVFPPRQNTCCRHSLNPIMNSGRETTLFPFKEGIAAFVIKDGNERPTIQYAEDGVNFTIMATARMMPLAAGPYIPDAFTNTKYGRGITWGICFAAPGKGKKGNMLLRFDCDLSLDVDDSKMKQRPSFYQADFLYEFGLDTEQKQRILKESRAQESD